MRRLLILTALVGCTGAPAFAQQAGTPPPAATVVAPEGLPPAVEPTVQLAPGQPAIALAPQARPAQTPRPTTPTPPGQPNMPAAPAPGQPPNVPVAPQPPAAPRPEPVPTQSVRIDVSITDSLSAGAPVKKVVTMLVADNRNGRIRSTNFVRFSEAPGQVPSQTPVTLNVDARPILRGDNRIQIDLTIEYMPEAPQGSSGLRPSSITESLSALVPDGKPTLLSQSADPVTDRKVSIEVTATVVK